MTRSHETTIELSGGCLCEAIRYRCTAQPCDVHYCHCRLCQKAFGNLFAVFGLLPRTALTFTRGRPRHYRSTPYAERGFCQSCGTPLTFRYLRSDWIAVSIGSLDHPEAAQPKKCTGASKARCRGCLWMMACHVDRSRAIPNTRLCVRPIDGQSV